MECHRDPRDKAVKITSPARSRGTFDFVAAARRPPARIRNKIAGAAVARRARSSRARAPRLPRGAKRAIYLSPSFSTASSHAFSRAAPTQRSCVDRSLSERQAVGNQSRRRPLRWHGVVRPRAPATAAPPARARPVRRRPPARDGRRRARPRDAAAALRRRLDGHRRPRRSALGGLAASTSAPRILAAKSPTRLLDRPFGGLIVLPTSPAASALLLDDLGPQLRRGLLDAQPQIVGVDGVHCCRRGRRSTRIPGVARRI